MTPPRPALRWHGGKWLLAPWIIGHFPEHRCYVEPFGGAASVLLRKPRSYAEIYNDLDKEVVALFRILRDPAQALELRRQLELTPFAREEFNSAYGHEGEPMDVARRLVIRSFMGFGSDGINQKVKTGFRSNSNRSGTTPAHDWVNLPDSLAVVGRRFAGVVIENRPAMSVCQSHDSPETLHYLDPPYLPELRSKKSRCNGDAYHGYNHEMTLEDHHEMLAWAVKLKGMVLVSGYPASIYDDALVGWRRVDRDALADGARKRVECLWINPAAEIALGHGPLFQEGVHA